MATFKPATDNPKLLKTQLNELNLARGGKSAALPDDATILEVDQKESTDDLALDLLRSRSTTTTSPRPINSFKELKKQRNEHDKDLQQLNDDLKLLSALLGRPISVAEIPSLVNQVGKSTGPSTVMPIAKAKSIIRSTASTAPPQTTRQTTTTTPEIFDVAKYLQQSAQASSSTLNPSLYGKSNEAVIASLLKEQGIGPENNNIPIDVSLVADSITKY